MMRAIGFADNRDEALNVYRAGSLNHKTMDGPFPSDTWAAPSSPQSLFRPDHADAEYKKVASKPSEPLTLKFANDPLARAACTLMKQQLARVGITVELMPLSLADPHKAVFVELDYGLAYGPYDYGSDRVSTRRLSDDEG